MRFNCFCAAAGTNLLDDASTPHPRPSTSSPTTSLPHRAKVSRRLHRNGSAGSTLTNSSWTSNESIARLPPCKRDSDPKIEAMMMPVPPNPRPSHCLRLSHPKTYSALVSDMKACKGTRDWRNFAVFYNDDVDESISAIDRARQRAKEYERKVKMLESFDAEEERDLSKAVEGLVP